MFVDRRWLGAIRSEPTRALGQRRGISFPKASLGAVGFQPGGVVLDIAFLVLPTRFHKAKKKKWDKMSNALQAFVSGWIHGKSITPLWNTLNDKFKLLSEKLKHNKVDARREEYVMYKLVAKTMPAVLSMDKPFFSRSKHIFFSTFPETFWYAQIFFSR